jgi:hypothetical protein
MPGTRIASRHWLRRWIAALALMPLPAAAQTENADTTTLPPVAVAAPSPPLGSGIDRNKAPTDVNRGLAPKHEPALRDWCCGWVRPDTEPSTNEASKVGALPQPPPGAEPLDLNTK